mgnify:CR=1 FL=1
MEKIRFRKGYPVAKDLRALAEEVGVKCYPSQAYPTIPQLVNSCEFQNDKVREFVEALKELGVGIESHTDASWGGCTNGIIKLAEKPPAKLTIKIICEAAAKRHGLKPDMVELSRYENVWHWTGKVGAVFSSSEALMGRLDGWSFDRWMEDFDSCVEEWRIGRSEELSLRDHINSIDWDIDSDVEVSPVPIKLALFSSKT